MKKPEIRHYTEEEILMHIFGEEIPGVGMAISSHLEECRQCSAIRLEFQTLRSRVSSWQVPELPEEVWRARKAEVMSQFRRDQISLRRQGGLLQTLQRTVEAVWNYAVENPLPTMGYIAVAVAFASERTISLFRLDKILPATNEVLEILRQIL